MVLCAIPGGEGPGTFLRPSPNHPATFPKRTLDLPHGIQLWRPSAAFSPGKVRHPYGEGLLFPPGTFPTTSSSGATQNPIPNISQNFCSRPDQVRTDSL